MKMNRKLLASLIAVGIMTTGTAFAAANPFDDVPKGHWSYEAVQTLADQGIVDGFGDGTFRGDKLMTRYEMAQIVGKAISKGKLAGSEGKSTIERLSAEYADELSSLGVRLDNVEKKTAGVNDLKISHWIQTENTYGDDYNGGGDLKEYELEYRLTVEKQISPKLSALHQLETKTYYDQPAYGSVDGDGDYGVRDGVYTRLAYITYKPDADNTIIAGKNAYWWAGGLLGDDYVEGVNYITKFDNKTSLELSHGRYWVDRDKDSRPGKENVAYGNDQITYAGLNTKFGTVDFGVHYLTGQNGIVKGGDTKIWAVTAATDIGGSNGVNLSLGYAKDTEQDDSNQLAKAQLYKKLGKTDTFIQYWKQQGNYNPPLENGNHLAWWGHQYGGQGIEGYRLILGYPVSANCYAEAWYGDYDATNTNSEGGKKYGWALTFMY